MKNKPQIRSRRLIDEKPWVRIKRVDSKSTVKIVDLFAGIGGFHYGIAAAASKINKGVKPLLVSELDPKCRNVYERNHNCVVQGDILLRCRHASMSGARISMFRAGFHTGNIILEALTTCFNFALNCDVG